MANPRGRPRTIKGLCAYCDRPAKYLDPPRCGSHYMRSRRGTPMCQPVRVVYPDRAAALYAAALKYAGAEDDDGFRAASSQLIAAAKRYANSPEAAT